MTIVKPKFHFIYILVISKSKVMVGRSKRSVLLAYQPVTMLSSYPIFNNLKILIRIFIMSAFQFHTPFFFFLNNKFPESWIWNGKLYLRVHIHSGFGHTQLRAQPLAWPVTLNMQDCYLLIQNLWEIYNGIYFRDYNKLVKWLKQ